MLWLQLLWISLSPLIVLKNYEKPETGPEDDHKPLDFPIYFVALYLLVIPSPTSMEELFIIHVLRADKVMVCSESS